MKILSLHATIPAGTICRATLLDGMREGLSTPAKKVDLKLKKALHRGIMADASGNGFTIKIRIFLSQVSPKVSNPRPAINDN